MKLSVIVPVFNIESYLPRFFGSVAEQLALHDDVELLLVNDGSGDKSGDLIDQFAATHPRVNAHHQENSGVSIARNVGVDLARGEYVSFADPDDWLDENYLDVIKQTLNFRDEVDVVVFGHKIHALGSKQGKAVHPARSEGLSGLEYMEKKLVSSGQIERPVWNKVYRAAFLNEAGVQFPVGLKLGEDMLFNLHAFYKAKMVAVTNEIIYHHDKSNTQSLTAIVNTDRMYGLSCRIALSRALREAAFNLPDEVRVKKQLLGFAYGETLRTTVKTIQSLPDADERVKISTPLMAELNKYPVKDISRYLTFTDMRLWWKLAVFADKQSALSRFYRVWFKSRNQFRGSINYWNQRYESGGNSGHGSYNRLANFKAEILNDFVARNGIQSVIEHGCGDGNQLKLAHYPSYWGLDVSPKAIAICKESFNGDSNKIFMVSDLYENQIADLSLSLDVIYHLTEESVYNDYMSLLFDSSQKYVAIYSSNTDENPDDQAPHVKHRCFSGWIEANRPEWKLMKHIPNRYPYKGDSKTGSFADFYIFEKAQAR